MSARDFAITVRKGEDIPRVAQLRHATMDQELIVPADVDTIKLRVLGGIGDGSTEFPEDRLIAPAPGLLNIADVIKDPPLTGPGWKGHKDGANFYYKFEWDKLLGDKYDGLRSYIEEYEIDCRGSGFSRYVLRYLVTVASTMGAIST